MLVIIFYLCCFYSSALCFLLFIFSFIFSSPLSDSPFFSAPFLDFKNLFQHSFCDGKFSVTLQWVQTYFPANNMSEWEGMEERTKRLCEWPFPLHGNMLEWSGTLWLNAALTTTFSQMAKRHVFSFISVCWSGWFKGLISNPGQLHLAALWAR